MILSTDVFYKEDGSAIASGVLFDEFSCGKENETILVDIKEVNDYESGQFYKRELPCLLALIKNLKELPKYIIVDSYVYLNDNLGLGGYLYEALNKEVIIIGVAKAPFTDISSATQIFRGDSKKALYITSAGIQQEEAKELIKNMHGKFRIPTMIRLADRIGRE